MSIKYEEISIENPLDGTVQTHVIVDLGDGGFRSFPADPENPAYVDFLKQLETA